MQIQTIEDTQPVINYLVATLSEHIQAGERVTWLIPGGSAIAIAAAVSQRLANFDLSKLSVTLTDERFGPVGHPDSNWLQLEQAGLRLPGAHLFPVLLGKELDETVDDYSYHLETLLGVGDFNIGLFGIGADGHTAGILPDSPPVNDETYAAGYEADSYTRVTMTFPAIGLLHESVIYACGANKLPTLTSLIHEKLPLSKQPAQIHTQIPRSVLFTDQQLSKTPQ